MGTKKLGSPAAATVQAAAGTDGRLGIPSAKLKTMEDL